MHAAQHVTSWAAVFYFLFFWVIVVIVILNMVISFVIEAFIFEWISFDNEENGSLREIQINDKDSLSKLKKLFGEDISQENYSGEMERN